MHLMNWIELSATFLSMTRKHLLVAVVFEVFLVAVILKDVLWVVLPKPLSFVNVKRAGLGLHFLTLSASWNWGRKT